MRRQLIALRLLLAILSVSLLVVSADLSWAQNQPPIEQIPAPIFDIAELRLPISEVKIHPRSLSMELPPILEINQREPRSHARFFTAALQSSGNYVIGGTPNKSFTFEPTYLKLSNQTVNCDSDVDYCGRLIPFIGPIILRVAQQAEAHPRITRVLMILQPQF